MVGVAPPAADRAALRKAEYAMSFTLSPFTASDEPALRRIALAIDPTERALRNGFDNPLNRFHPTDVANPHRRCCVARETTSDQMLGGGVIFPTHGAKYRIEL